MNSHIDSLQVWLRLLLQRRFWGRLVVFWFSRWAPWPWCLLGQERSWPFPPSSCTTSTRLTSDRLGKRARNDWSWTLKFCIEFGIECHYFETNFFGKFSNECCVFKKSFNLILVLIFKKLSTFKVIGKYFFILISYMFQLAFSCHLNNKICTWDTHNGHFVLKLYFFITVETEWREDNAFCVGKIKRRH